MTIPAFRAVPSYIPIIVCLCGSTRFKDEFIRANAEETGNGKIVLSVGFYGRSMAFPLPDELKKQLDELHLRKIDLADEVFILNVNGYIGESTRRELVYAFANRKKIRFLNEKAGEKYLEENSHSIAFETVQVLRNMGLL